MDCSFPRRIASVEEWLAALNMEKYVPAFASIALSELRTLNDERLREMGIDIPGHRKRLLLGVAVLEPPRNVSPLPPAAPKAPSRTRDPQSTCSAVCASAQLSERTQGEDDNACVEAPLAAVKSYQLKYRSTVITRSQHMQILQQLSGMKRAKQR